MYSPGRLSIPTAVASGICLLCAGLVLSGCSGRRSEQYRGEGDIHLRQGDYDAAEAQYRLAVETDADNALAHAGLGRVLGRRAKVEEAVASYRRAIEIDPNLVAAYKEAGRLLQDNGDTAGAKSIAESLRAVEPVEGVILLATVLGRSGSIEEAIKLLEDGTASSRDSAAVHVSLAAHYISAGRPDDAEPVLQAILDRIDPESVPARILLVESYRASGKVAEMIRELEEISASRPEDTGAKLMLALALLDDDRIEEAEAIALPMMETHPDSPWVRFVVGSALMRREQYTEAVAHLQIASDILPNQPVVAERLALARAGTPAGRGRPARSGTAGNVAGAGQRDWRALWNEANLVTLLETRNADSSSSEAGRVEALVLSAVFIGDFELANEISAQLPADSPLHKYLDNVGTVLDRKLSEDDVNELMSLLEPWSSAESDKWLLRQNAEGFVLARIGLRAKAFSKYAGISEEHPENGVALRNLASMYRTVGMDRFAAKCMERLVGRHGASPELRELLFEAYRRAGMTTELRTLAESIYAVTPEDPQAIIRLASIYYESGEVDVALQLLQRAAAEVQTVDGVKMALAVAYLRSGEPQSALDQLSRLDDAASVAPQAIATIRGFANAQLDDWENVLSAVDAFQGDRTNNALLFLKAASLINLEKDGEAAQILPPVRTVNSNRQAAARLLGASVGSQDPESTLVEALRGDRSERQRLAFGIACWEAHLDLDALAIFDELLDRRPGTRTYVDAMASILYRGPGTAERLALAASLVQNNPDSASAHVALSAVQGKSGKRDGQKASLLKAVELDPKSVDAWSLLFQFAEEIQDDSLALECTKRLLELDSDNPVFMNNFAYFQIKTGADAAMAVAYAQKAFEARPSDSAVLHTLAMSQLAAGSSAEGMRNLRLVLQTRPGDPTPSFDYGKLLIEQGRAEEGAQYIATALLYARNFDLEFPEQAEAERLLEQLRPGADGGL